MAADYDLIAVGGGTAGLVTAAGGAGLGARVALVERHRLGGECLWTGCVPSKALLACARAAADACAAGAYGVQASAIKIDFEQVMNHVRQAQRAIEPHDSPERFRGLGVDVIHGTARFVGERTLRIGDRTISGRHIVIATGSRPAIPPIRGLETVRYQTNETVFDIAELPASIAVLGGGAAGVELGQAFALLGSRVTVLEAADRILPREDAELVAILAAELERAGIAVKTGRQVQRVESFGGQIRLHMEGETVSAAALLVATSRESILDTLDLSAGGIAFTERALTLDHKLRTTAANV
jgi:pyruvate/2-oxoglutarate dehydrogenase complex dihydrolipoamide dehydrogenase (E3) component